MSDENIKLMRRIVDTHLGHLRATGKPELADFYQSLLDKSTEVKTKEEPKKMPDAELLALAALANVEAVLMAGDNAQREIEGHSPAWRVGCGFLPAGTALIDELYKRGYKV